MLSRNRLQPKHHVLYMGIEWCHAKGCLAITSVKQYFLLNSIMGLGSDHNSLINQNTISKHSSNDSQKSTTQQQTTNSSLNSLSWCTVNKF